MRPVRLADSISIVPANALIHAASADVVHDNLGVGDTYEPQVPWVVSDGPPFRHTVEQAMPFSPTSSGALGAVEFPITMQ